MKEHMKGMVFKGNDKPIKNLNKSAAAMKKDDGKRATSSPFQKNKDSKIKKFAKKVYEHSPIGRITKKAKKAYLDFKGKAKKKK